MPTDRAVTGSSMPANPRPLLRAAALTLGALLFAAPSAATAQQQDTGLSADLDEIRAALDRYQDPYRAVHDLYLSTVGCVEYPRGGMPGHVDYEPGGMGVHFLNVPLFMDGEVDPQRPEVLIYERTEDGELRLAAAEWMVPAGPETERPELFGREFEGPMVGHVPLMPQDLHHYDLHLWLWKDNPAGIAAPTNPELDCPDDDRYTVEEEAPELVGGGARP